MTAQTKTAARKNAPADVTANADVTGTENAPVVENAPADVTANADVTGTENAPVVENAPADVTANADPNADADVKTALQKFGAANPRATVEDFADLHPQYANHPTRKSWPAWLAWSRKDQNGLGKDHTRTVTRAPVNPLSGLIPVPVVLPDWVSKFAGSIARDDSGAWTAYIDPSKLDRETLVRVLTETATAPTPVTPTAGA